MEVEEAYLRGESGRQYRTAKIEVIDLGPHKSLIENRLSSTLGQFAPECLSSDAKKQKEKIMMQNRALSKISEEDVKNGKMC